MTTNTYTNQLVSYVVLPQDYNQGNPPKERDENLVFCLFQAQHSLAAYNTKNSSLTATYLVVEKAPSQSELS